MTDRELIEAFERKAAETDGKTLVDIWHQLHAHLLEDQQD